MIITIPTVSYEGEDMVYPYLAFCYKMKYQNREWTGYKELKDTGLDPDGLISLGILFDPTPTGTYRFISENIPNLVNIYAIEAPALYYTSDALGAINKKSVHIGHNYLSVEGAAFDDCPIGVNPIKGAINMFVATVLKERSNFDSYVRSMDYLDEYDWKLFDYLSDNRKTSVKAKVGRGKKTGEGCDSIKDMVEEYADKQVRAAIRTGSFDSQPDYVKKWFESRVRQSKHRMRVYSYLFSDQPNKEKK